MPIPASPCCLVCLFCTVRARPLEPRQEFVPSGALAQSMVSWRKLSTGESQTASETILTFQAASQIGGLTFVRPHPEHNSEELSRQLTMDMSALSSEIRVLRW